MDEEIDPSLLERGAVRNAGYAVAIFVIGQTVLHIELSRYGHAIGAIWPSTIQPAQRINRLLHVIVYMISRLSVAALCGSADDDRSDRYAETQICGRVLGYRSFDSDVLEKYIAEGLDPSTFVSWPEILPRVEELENRLQKVAESLISIPEFLSVIKKVADALLTQSPIDGTAATDLLSRHVPETLRSEWEQMLRCKVTALVTSMTITLKSAVESVHKYLSTYEPASSRAVVVPEATLEKSYGWVFFYQSETYLETSDPSRALIGNGPIIVTKYDGAFHQLSSGPPPMRAIKNFEAMHVDPAYWEESLRPEYRRILFFDACEAGDIQRVEQMVKEGMFVDEADDRQQTALFQAAYARNTRMVKWLLDRGADVNHRTVYGDTVLMRAAERGDSKMVRLLLRYGADVHVQDVHGNSAFSLASKREGVVRIIRRAEGR